jgi:hypothetical protein
MRHLVVILVAFLVFGAAEPVANAAVRPYAKLSVDERIALQESERRVAVYDKQLLALDRERARGKISLDDYRWANQQLVLCIQQESLFQNTILVRQSDLPDRAKAVLETMEHGVLMIPVTIGCVVASCPQVLQFLACIH